MYQLHEKFYNLFQRKTLLSNDMIRKKIIIRLRDSNVILPLIFGICKQCPGRECRRERDRHQGEEQRTS